MRILMVIPLVISITIISFSQIKMETETTINAQGEVETIYITPGSTAEFDQSEPGIKWGSDQQVLWMDDHPTSIAEHMAISGNGVYAVAGWWLNVERTSKYEILGNGSPLWEYSIVPNFKMPVASSDDGNVIASTGDVIPLSVWLNGAGPNPSWQYNLPTGYKSYGCDVSDDGSRIACAYKQESGNGGKLLVFNSTGGDPIYDVNFDAENGVNGVVLSANGNWAVVSTYHYEYVFNLTNFTLFWTGSNYGQGTAAIDDDAEWLAKGDFYGQLSLYHRTSNGYNLQWQNYFGGWVTAVAVSGDGSTIMGGNLLFGPYRGVVRVLDINGNILFEYDQYGDEVGDVALSYDGSKAVAASWGQYNGTFGDVFTAFDVNTGNVIFNLLDDIDEPGSIFCADISDDGSYAVCGGKAVHARQMGNGGQAYAIELSEPGPFNISITLIPDTLPIVIPANGGPFFYAVEIVNNENVSVSFRAWTEAQLPNGSTYGPILDRNLTLNPGATIYRPLTQNVPGTAPAGDYVYRGKVGTPSGIVWNDDSFPFTKTADGANGYGGWAIYGWGENPAENGIAPAEYQLSQNYPNPFNNATIIEFNLPNREYVNLAVFNVLGEKVQDLISGYYSEGAHSVTFDAERLSSGIYFYRINAGKFNDMKKMILIK